jgi:selenocysteine lyase/cysteine desulfurase
MLRTHFLFHPSYTPLNHGSFGAYPLPVQTCQTNYNSLAHSRPDTFIVSDLPKLINKSREAVAPLLGAHVDEIVLVPNATTGVNTVLRNIRWEEGDVVLYFSTIYDSCHKTIAHLSEMGPVRGVGVTIEFPISEEEIVQRFRKGIDMARRDGKTVRMAMFDTVLTFPGVRLPWEKLVETCTELGVLSLIDGAHGVGKFAHLSESLLNDNFESGSYY